MNVGAAMDLSDLDADWARMCLGDGEWGEGEAALSGSKEPQG
jgi:hypothetical protein